MPQHPLTDIFFDSFDLHPHLLAGLHAAGFTRCTPIQALTLPLALAGRDVAGQAQTGTGKTAAFLVAVLQRLMTQPAFVERGPSDPRALVIAPTRELAIQIEKDFQSLGRNTGIKSALIYGGVDYDKQREQLRAGVDIVAYSGDKLLGGPQSGLLSGRADLVARMRSNSLFRALRVDKLTYAALEATLLAYVKRDHDAVPVLRMMRLSKDDISRRAQQIVAHVEAAQLKHVKLELIEGESVIGGGAAPSAVLPTSLIALTHSNRSADELNDRLRNNTPPVIARVEDGRVLIDLRTVFPEQDATLGTALASLS